MFSIVIRQSFTFSPAKLSIFTNLNFENSIVILISLAKNHDKLIFDYFLAPSWFFLPKIGKIVFFCDLSANTAIFGVRGGGFTFSPAKMSILN